ncbi:MAG TPA: hypothetical protein VFY71_15975, partial [Planctomycetota bacterium]|nr:hypothetical protein [Planctomycetota bacterium]
IHWTSSTAVNPAAAAYDSSYHLDLVEVKIHYLFFTLGPFDITDQIPPEVQTGGGSFDGPAPLTLFGGQVAYPLPPDPPSVAADIAIGLNASGAGSFDASNVVLGSITLDVAPFGTITAQIVSVHIQGSLSIEATQWQDLGGALAGSLGLPLLTGDGPLTALSPLSLSVANAQPNAGLTLIAGFFDAELPFKGGTLVPSPDIIVLGLSTGPAGSFTLGTTWPAGVPAGFHVDVQGWIADAAGPKGFAATNGLSGTAP